VTILERTTRETQIRLQLECGVAEAQSDVRTSVPFLTHMVATLARYASFQLQLEASGDLRHHVIEDVAITLGLALRDETPAACARYGEALIPMDDALVQVAVDLGGRAFYGGSVPSSLYDHFLRSLAENGAFTLHVHVILGSDRHHVVEAAFKALGLALRHALSPGTATFSTKGTVQLERGGG
jgi:imidazoleglycerol-phosphate dehydratase